MEQQKIGPTAWLHTMTYETGDTNRRLSFSRENPFGVPGKDYSADFEVTCEPLYDRAALNALSAA